MFSLVDLVLLKDRSLKRADVEKILTITGETIKEKVQEGATVSWVGLCTFTYKKKATTKKQQKEWEANPELAIGDKVRVESELDGLNVKGHITRYKRGTNASSANNE